MNDKKTNPYKEPQTLTYEEHKQIDEFLRFFQEKGPDIFKLFRKSFGDKGEPVRRMAKAVNFLGGIDTYCETRACFDRPRPMFDDNPDLPKWENLYRNMTLWQTTGWK